ncbi:hypothetical protein C8Q74DRAFT_1214811 [Fomes fomentarius]|nr:hypothetical protein C8Q74DRAFT_1214811 [Fomes fomentarius]
MSSATLPTGNNDARYSTTAALAETEASTATLSNQIEQNASELHTAAVDAAKSAEGSRASNAADRLEEGLSQKTNAAASEGAADVSSAKAAATGYAEQAKNFAGGAIATAQSYISGATGNPQTTTQTNGTKTSGTNVVQSAIATGKEYLSSAQATAQPYVDSAIAAAQPHIEKAKGVVTGTTTYGSFVSGEPSEVPSKTAPLESGPNTVGNPYPATVNGQTTKVGEL